MQHEWNIQTRTYPTNIFTTFQHYTTNRPNQESESWLIELKRARRVETTAPSHPRKRDTMERETRSWGREDARELELWWRWRARNDEGATTRARELGEWDEAKRTACLETHRIEFIQEIKFNFLVWNQLMLWNWNINRIQFFKKVWK